MRELFKRYSTAVDKDPGKTLGISAVVCILPMLPLLIMFTLPDSTRYIDGIEVLAIFCFGLFVIGIIGELIVFAFVLGVWVSYSPDKDKQKTTYTINNSNQNNSTSKKNNSRKYATAAVAGVTAAEMASHNNYETNKHDNSHINSSLDYDFVNEEHVYEAYDEYGNKMDELDFEIADGYYDEWGDYHSKTGSEFLDLDDEWKDPDYDEELDVIYRNEAIDNSMDMFGFGDDSDGGNGDW